MKKTNLSKMTVHEMIMAASNLQHREERIAKLQEFNCLALRNVLRGGFDDEIQFLLPDGEPPYQPAPAQNPPSSLQKQSRRFGYFNTGGKGEKMSAVKRESMYISLLESIHPDDAAVVILMVSKKLDGRYRGITKKIVSEAYPNLITK